MKDLKEMKEILEEERDRCVVNVYFIKSKRGEITSDDLQLRRFYEGKEKAFEEVIEMIDEMLPEQKEEKE